MNIHDLDRMILLENSPKIDQNEKIDLEENKPISGPEGLENQENGVRRT